MRKIRSTLVATALLMTTGPALADQYLCVADLSTGFRWNGTAWDYARFNATARYIVTQEEPFRFGVDDVQYDYKVTEIGFDFAMFPACVRGDPEQYRVIRCNSFGSSMMINAVDLRYTLLFGGGYAYGGDEGADTPFIEIGRCSPF